MKCNRLIGPKFNFRNRSLINSYLKSTHFILIQEARLDQYAKDALKLSYNIIFSSKGSPLSGGLCIFSPFDLTHVFETIDNDHMLAIVMNIPTGEKIIIANLYGEPSSNTTKKKNLLQTLTQHYRIFLTSIPPPWYT